MAKSIIKLTQKRRTVVKVFYQWTLLLGIFVIGLLFNVSYADDFLSVTVQNDRSGGITVRLVDNSDNNHMCGDAIHLAPGGQYTWHLLDGKDYSCDPIYDHFTLRATNANDQIFDCSPGAFHMGTQSGDVSDYPKFSVYDNQFNQTKCELKN